MPIGIARRQTVTSVAPARMAERPSASPTSPATGRDSPVDIPQSPRRMPPNQCRYCCHHGSFSPRVRSSAWSCSGVANSPRIITAALPGRSWVMPNTVKETTSSTSRIAPTRRSSQPAVTR